VVKTYVSAYSVSVPEVISVAEKLRRRGLEENKLNTRREDRVILHKKLHNFYVLINVIKTSESEGMS
jgi:hypothetical protein